MRSFNRSSHHRQHGLRFGTAICLRHQCIRAESAAVLHQDTTDVAQLRGLPISLAELLGLRVRRFFVNVVASKAVPTPARSKNHRNRKSYCSRSQKSLSDRTE